jgi:transcription elongation factor GreA
MAEERFVLTRNGYALLERELEDLLRRSAEEIAQQMADAHDDTEFGEEATFFDAVVAKEQLDQRIAHLRRVLARAEILGDDPDPTRVDPGDRITAWDFADQREVTFDLLGSAEVTYGHRGISIESPVGRALLGRSVGDVIEVEVPDGKARYAIRKIERIPTNP